MSILSVDTTSFLTGGYGALGVSIFTRNMYKGVEHRLAPIAPNTLVEQPPDLLSSTFERYAKIIAKQTLVQLRAFEKIFIGGSLYTATEKILISQGSKSRILNSIVCGGLVGAYQSGYGSSWQTLGYSTATVAAAAVSQEIFVFALLAKGYLLERPMWMITMNYNPLLFVIGALGAYQVGAFTKSFNDGMQYIRFPNRGENYEVSIMTYLKQVSRFMIIHLTNPMIFEMRVEERQFVGGSLAWGVEHVFRKIGVENKFIRAAVAGGIVGAYFGTYGKNEVQIWLSSVGVAALGLGCELLLPPLAKERKEWKLFNVCELFLALICY